MFIVNPNSMVNRNIPNMQVAFASAQYKCRVVDQNTMPDPPDRFMDIDDKDMVISVRSLNYTEAERVAKIYKEKYPGARIRSLRGFLDIQCCYPFLDFDDRLIFNVKFSDEFEYPDYDMFDSIEVFRNKWARAEWNFPIMTSLGCPFQCIYCSSRNRHYYMRSVDHCVGELKEAMKKWKFDSFEILDDCFNVNKDRIIEFCEKVTPLKMRWFCTNGLRADLFDEDIAKALKKSGCAFISFGIESLEPEILKLIKKGETYEQIESAVTIARKYFGEVNGYFIIGLPGSSFEKDLKTLDWAKKHGLNAHFSYYVPSDEGLPRDTLFYGEVAEPKSNAYPMEQQQKLYEMTMNMRASYKSKENLIKRGIRKLTRIFRGK